MKEEIPRPEDELLDDMWGLICNVNEGRVEDEKEEWYEAFLRIREKYHLYLQLEKDEN